MWKTSKWTKVTVQTILKNIVSLSLTLSIYLSASLFLLFVKLKFNYDTIPNGDLKKIPFLQTSLEERRFHEEIIGVKKKNSKRIHKKSYRFKKKNN